MHSSFIEYDTPKIVIYYNLWSMVVPKIVVYCHFGFF